MKKHIIALLPASLFCLFLGVDSVFASDDSTADVSGSVRFHKGDDDSKKPGVIPPNNPGGDPEIPDGGGSEGSGNFDFKINWVTDLDFGDIEVKNSEMHSFANAVFFKNNTAEYAPYIQMTDIRTNPSGWKLSVSSSDFKTSDGNVLKGSSIIFKDKMLIATSGQTDSKPYVTDHSTLMPNTGPITLIEADSGNGEGVWTLSFTNHHNGLYAPERGVKLSIPSNAIPRTDSNYVSNLTWTLTSDPS